MFIRLPGGADIGLSLSYFIMMIVFFGSRSEKDNGVGSVKKASGAKGKI